MECSRRGNELLLLLLLQLMMEPLKMTTNAGLKQLPAARAEDEQAGDHLQND
jgi:hypothetical protein